MKNSLKVALRSLPVLAFVAASLAGALAQAQSRDVRVISAHAGGVNFVSGKVEFNREGETAWAALSDKDELKSGDAVRTGQDGRAEVLLNPGSYMRLGSGSQLELADASLDDLRLKLTRGSAVIEAAGYDKLGLSIVVETPQTRVRILRTGIYRFNVLPSGLTEVAVQKGRALVGKDELLVKGGHVARVAAGSAPEVAKAKFEKKDRDALDLWSRERGKELAKLNEKLSSRNTNFPTFPNIYSSSLNGIWYRHSLSGTYTFLPFFGACTSPYGHSYWSWLYLPYGAPVRGGDYFPNGRGGPYGGPGPVGTNTVGGGGSHGGNTTTSAPMPQPARELPPARDMQRAEPMNGGGRHSQGTSQRDN